MILQTEICGRRLERSQHGCSHFPDGLLWWTHQEWFKSNKVTQCSGLFCSSDNLRFLVEPFSKGWMKWKYKYCPSANRLKMMKCHLIINNQSRTGLSAQTPFYLCEECTKNMSLGCFSCRLDQSADLQHDLFRNNWGPAQPNTLHLSPALNVCINNIPVCSLPKSITAEKRLELVMLEITSGPAPPRNPACWGTWADPIRPPSDELATFYLTFRLTAINQVGERCRLEWSVQIPLFIAR